MLTVKTLIRQGGYPGRLESSLDARVILLALTSYGSLMFQGNRYIFKGNNSVEVVLVSFGKGVYPKRKEFAPLQQTIN